MNKLGLSFFATLLMLGLLYSDTCWARGFGGFHGAYRGGRGVNVRVGGVGCLPYGGYYRPWAAGYGYGNVAPQGPAVDLFRRAAGGRPDSGPTITRGYTPREHSAPQYHSLRQRYPGGDAKGFGSGGKEPDVASGAPRDTDRQPRTPDRDKDDGKRELPSDLGMNSVARNPYAEKGDR